MGSSKRIVESLYDGLAKGEMEEVARLLVPDLEWWFHGPPRCDHMMRVLTGATEEEHGFRFYPKRVVEMGKWVVAEGWEGEQAYWVHVWVVDGGVITRFREYFNTWVTVRELGRSDVARTMELTVVDRADRTVWRSQKKGQMGRSMPCLILAI